jgi:serine/threonine protein kinase/Flp pilus assembly protein TadD
MSDVDRRLATALAERYRLERELGQGGMATVYLAHDLRHKRDVAIKVLRPELASALGPERFLREIQTTANLRHPGILPLYDSGDAGGFLFYVMPFIEGESLRDRLVRERQLPVDAALQLAREAADALGYAHARGVIHRDIKPENILLENGHAVVADFGIAKAVSTLEGGTLTQTGLAVGTPAYMSPEQVLADSALDGRSDLYSLGCVLFEMLTGEPPFAAATPQRTIARRLTEPPPEPALGRPEIGAQLSGAVRRVLATDPADRPATAAEFANSLALTAQSTPAQPVAPPVRSGATTTPGRGTATRAAGLVVLPFVNRSPDSGDEYFSDGLTEEIISDLASIKALSVISRTSAMRFKGSDKDVRTIGRELGVRYALEGSVRKAGSSLRITAQLIDAEADAQLWSEKYSGTMDDVFEVQERVSREIVKALGVTLSTAEDQQLAARPIQNVRAFELFLQARHEIRGFTTLPRGKELAREAMEIEGKTAPLLWLLAWADVSLVKVGLGDPAILKQCAGQADALIAMAPDAPYGYGLHGYISFERGNHAEAVRYFRAALERDPNDTDSMFWMIVSYWNAGHADAVRPLVQRLMTVDPLGASSWLAQGVTEWFTGRLADGPASLRRALELDPQGYLVRWSLGYTLALAGDLAGAARETMWCASNGPQVPYTWQLQSLVASLEGDRARGLAALAPVKTGPLDFHLTFHLAESYAMAGASERALGVLEEAVDKGFYAYEFMTKSCPFMVPLRGLPEFDRVMAKARRRWEEFGRTIVG